MTQYYIDPQDPTKLTTKYLNGGIIDGLIPVRFVDPDKCDQIAGYVLIDYGKTNQPFSSSGFTPACEFIPPQLFRKSLLKKDNISHFPEWSFPRMAGVASDPVCKIRDAILMSEMADNRYAISGRMREDHDRLKKYEKEFEPCVIDI